MSNFAWFLLGYVMGIISFIAYGFWLTWRDEH